MSDVVVTPALSPGLRACLERVSADGSGLTRRLAGQLLRECEAAEHGFPKWLHDAPDLLAFFALPRTPEEKADPEFGMPDTSSEACDRALVVLLRLSDRETPEPSISPTEYGGIDVSWWRDEPRLMAEFEVRPGAEEISACGSGIAGGRPWSGPVEEHWEDFKRLLNALASG